MEGGPKQPGQDPVAVIESIEKEWGPGAKQSKKGGYVKQHRGKYDDIEKDCWIVPKRDAPDLRRKMSSGASVEKILVDEIRLKLLRLSCIESAGWFRSHRKERRWLFTPMKVSEGPNNSRQAGPIRLTRCESDLGHSTIYIYIY